MYILVYYRRERLCKSGKYSVFAKNEFIKHNIILSKF